jgi:excisionase family DNA binding protein
MADEKLLTVREVSLLLNISEKEVTDLAETGRLPAYKVGGVYVRFKKEQVLEYRKQFHPSSAAKLEPAKKNSFSDSLNDFFYFNDFYILAATLIVLLLTVILRG